MAQTTFSSGFVGSLSTPVHPRAMATETPDDAWMSGGAAETKKKENQVKQELEVKTEGVHPPFASSSLQLRIFALLLWSIAKSS